MSRISCRKKLAILHIKWSSEAIFRNMLRRCATHTSSAYVFPLGDNRLMPSANNDVIYFQIAAQHAMRRSHRINIFDKSSSVVARLTRVVEIISCRINDTWWRIWRNMNEIKYSPSLISHREHIYNHAIWNVTDARVLIVEWPRTRKKKQEETKENLHINSYLFSGKISFCINDFIRVSRNTIYDIVQTQRNK